MHFIGEQFSWYCSYVHVVGAALIRAEALDRRAWARLTFSTLLPGSDSPGHSRQTLTLSAEINYRHLQATRRKKGLAWLVDKPPLELWWHHPITILLKLSATTWDNETTSWGHWLTVSIDHGEDQTTHGLCESLALNLRPRSSRLQRLLFCLAEGVTHCSLGHFWRMTQQLGKNACFWPDRYANYYIQGQNILKLANAHMAIDLDFFITFNVCECDVCLTLNDWYVSSWSYFFFSHWIHWLCPWNK